MRQTIDAAFCEAIKTQTACFEQGCSFFTNAAVLKQEEQNMCSQEGSFGICVFAQDRETAPERLTTYQRTLSDGTIQTLQLNFDATLDGWDRCGALAAPPDCDCDGS